MDHQTLHALELAAAITVQTFLLAAAWGFLGAIFACNTIVVPDYLANLMSSLPTETTWIITFLATILSVTTTACLSVVFKEALRRRMHASISLVQLSTGIALARGLYFINFRHLTFTLVTLAVFGATKLLVSSWSTLLTPTEVNWFVDASGWELDLTSSWFESTLQQELVRSGAALVRGNSTDFIGHDGPLSGSAAAGTRLGRVGIFYFNGIKYNVSTGGILPAVPEFGGVATVMSDNHTGLAFAGGHIPTHLDVQFPYGQARQGLQQSFSLVQQGLTANVTCRQTNGATNSLNLNYSVTQMPAPFANGTTEYWLWAWDITADCSEGLPSRQPYVTRSNSSTIPQDSTSGFMASLVCPYPILQTGFTWENFTVITNATWRYKFFPLTICTINPLVTTSLVTYANASINTTVISSQSLGSSNTNLTRFLAAMVNSQAWSTQGLTANSIGDALYSIYVFASGNDSNTPDHITDLLTRELAQYWRGVIEFAGSFLRSGFSVNPSTIPPEARIPLSGHEIVTTMGWHSRSGIWVYTAIPITVVALVMYAPLAYTLWQVWKERGHNFTTFDPSNPIHLMMVSSAREPGKNDSLDCALNGFERGRMSHNESVMVELIDVPRSKLRCRSEYKRFKVSALDASSTSDIDKNTLQV